MSQCVESHFMTLREGCRRGLWMDAWMDGWLEGDYQGAWLISWCAVTDCNIRPVTIIILKAIVLSGHQKNSFLAFWFS